MIKNQTLNYYIQIFLQGLILIQSRPVHPKPYEGLLDATPICSKALQNRSLKACRPILFPTEAASYKQNISNSLSEKVYRRSGANIADKAYELEHVPGSELMRTKYCIRHELGMCPVHQGAKAGTSLFLLNNGKRFALKFDCRNCEMTVCEDSTI